MADEKKSPPKSAKESLLGELESIKGLLDEQDSATPDPAAAPTTVEVPLLDDVVNHQHDENIQALNSAKQGNNAPNDQPPSPPLLNLDSIFDNSENGSSEDNRSEDHSSEDHSMESNRELNLDHLDADQLSHSEALTNFSLNFGASPTPEESGPAAESHRHSESIPAPEPPVLDNELIGADVPPVDTRQGDTPSNRPDFSIELMIQDIVDEHIPIIEAQLRERLSACEPELIRQLAEKHRKR